MSNLLKGHYHKKKNNAGSFVKGHKPFICPKEKSEDVVSAYVTRSESEKESEHTMRIIHQERVDKMWNYAMKEHDQRPNKCNNKYFKTIDVYKKAMVFRQKIKCLNCEFETCTFKIYDEVEEPHKRGPKHAVTNLALQSAILSAPIGQGVVRNIMASIDIPTLNKSQMDDSAKKISSKVVELSEQNMEKNLNEAALQGDGGVDGAFDVRYNAKIGNSRRHGGSLANQAIAFGIEKNTGGNKIVAHHLLNKVCHKCNLLRAKGKQVNRNHPGCAANLDLHASLTESALGFAIGEKLRRQNITIKTCTTDGDAGFPNGLEKGLGTTTQRKRDPIHLKQGQIHNGKKASFSLNIFPGIKTKKEKKRCEDALAVDISTRTFQIRKNIQKIYKGDVDKMKSAVPDIIDTIIDCYTGKCGQKCKNNPEARCAGGKGKDNWIGKSFHLQRAKIHKIKATQKDEQEIRRIVETILSPAAILKTSLMTTTQHNEAANRSVSTNCPKNLKFSRNLPARIASAIIKINEGPGKAFTMKLNALNLPISGGQKSFANKEQKKHEVSKIYVRNPLTIKRRFARDCKRREDRAAWISQVQAGPSGVEASSIASDYKKYHEDEPESVSTTKNNNYYYYYYNKNNNNKY